MVLRVAIVADTHGWIDPRIADLVADCDLAVHGGDIGNACVLARMQPRSGRVYAVRGNNDVGRKWPSEDRGLLGQIPDMATVELPGGSLVVVHGHRMAARSRHARLRRRHPDARAIVYGHSHHLVEDREQAPWVLNPGAAGRSRTFGGPSCIILTAGDQGWDLTLHRFALSHGRRRRRERPRSEAAA